MKRMLSFAGKIWAYYAVILILTLVFTLGISNTVVRIILDTALIGIFAYMSYAEGAYRGERAVSVGETIRVQEKEGRPVLEEQRSQVFSPKFAVCAMLIAALPFLAVSGINAVCYPAYMAQFRQEQAEKAEADKAKEQTAETAVAAEADAAEAGGVTEADLTEALVEEAQEEQLRPRPQHWARLAAWVVMLPFSSFNMLCSDFANMLLFFFYSVLLPGAGLGGYLMGPRLHKNKIKAMKKGSRKKRKRLLVTHQPKPPKAVV